MMEIDEGISLAWKFFAERVCATAPQEFHRISHGGVMTGAGELKSAGYVHTKFSNWAGARLESRHNLKDWQRQPYLGFGAGAHSFSGAQLLGQSPRPACVRWCNLRMKKCRLSLLMRLRQRLRSMRILPWLAATCPGIEIGRVERQYWVMPPKKSRNSLAAACWKKAGGLCVCRQHTSVSNESWGICCAPCGCSRSR